MIKITKNSNLEQLGKFGHLMDLCFLIKIQTTIKNWAHPCKLES